MKLATEPGHTLTIAPRMADRPNVWWVNQRQHFADEARHSILRAPLRVHECYVNVGRLRRGDIIIHHVAGFIRAIGTVTANPVEIPDPLGLEAGKLRVGMVKYFHIERSIGVAYLPEAWKLDESRRQALIVGGDTLNRRPFDRRGTAHDGYLFGLSQTFVQHLLEVPEFAGAFERATGGQAVLKEAR